MKSTLFLLSLVLLQAGALADSVRAEDWVFITAGDLRVRQEILDGVYHFAPESDRNWIRMRSRLGGQLVHDTQGGEIRLANEHRHILHPDSGDFDWDELVLDRLLWRWGRGGSTTFTLGRQDIIWDRGFLVLEGHPLDGSRSIYQDAARLQLERCWGRLDLFASYNPKRDPLVLVDDKDRALTDADETALAVRLTRGAWKWSLIWKGEDDPDGLLADLATTTLGARYDHTFEQGAQLLAELAVQYQSRSALGSEPADQGWALAGQSFLTKGLGHEVTGEAGFFYYSGSGKGLRDFRAPWGRWPKWSEMYIYTLIGESTAGRVHVAAWENIAGPRLTLRRPLGERYQARFGVTELLAPVPRWEARGWLTETELKADLGRGLTGHVLWEMFQPGSYHDGRGGLPPLTDTIPFLRWQVTYAFN